MNNNEIKKAQKSIKIIAEKENISVDEVREEMKAAIAEGLQSADPAVRKMWREIPCKGEAPEPEELIAWLAERVRGMVSGAG